MQFTLERTLIVRLNVSSIGSLAGLPTEIVFATGSSLGPTISYGEYRAPKLIGEEEKLLLPLNNGAIITITRKNKRDMVVYEEVVDGKMRSNFAGIYIGTARRCISEPNGQGRFVCDPKPDDLQRQVPVK